MPSSSSTLRHAGLGEDRAASTSRRRCSRPPSGSPFSDLRGPRFSCGMMRSMMVVLLGRLLGRAGDDQRRARLVDQDRVDLVDDREVELALHVLLERELHVVAQVVEAELVVRAVGDVGLVGLLAGAVVDAVHDHADLEAEEVVQSAHPLGVAARQVVVDGDDVHALAAQSVQVDRQGGDQRLALAGLHLGDVAPVEHDAADELHVEVPHAEGALGRLPAGGEGGAEDVVEGRPLIELLLERGRPSAELGVAELRDLLLERVDLVDEGPQALQLAVVLRSDDFLDDCAQHGSDRSPRDDVRVRRRHGTRRALLRRQTQNATAKLPGKQSSVGRGQPRPRPRAAARSGRATSPRRTTRTADATLAP